MELYTAYVNALRDALAVDDIDYVTYRILKDAADSLRVHLGPGFKTSHIQRVRGHALLQQQS